MPKTEDHHFRLRVPTDLQSRIEESARRHGRSINAEIVQALEQYFPPEPSVDDLLDTIQGFVNFSARPDAPAYRQGLIDSIKRLERRLEAGVEFETEKSKVWSKEQAAAYEAGTRQTHMRQQWHRQKEAGIGVTTEQFAEFLREGLLQWIGEERFRAAYERLAAGDFRGSLQALALGATMFADPEGAKELLASELERMRREYGLVLSGAAPMSDSEKLAFLTPFIRDRDKTVMDALASADLDGAVAAARAVAAAKKQAS